MPRYDIYAGTRTEIDQKFNEIMASIEGEKSTWLKKFVVEHWGIQEKKENFADLLNEFKETVRRETIAEILKMFQDTTNRMVVPPTSIKWSSSKEEYVVEDLEKRKEAAAKVEAMTNEW